ncbi:hypothetical protein GF371_05495 [Candidatus Woesearchaeota archaeon]|nr:hypothetical protein [Candidatus Woesearchaeota archaeon]
MAFAVAAAQDPYIKDYWTDSSSYEPGDEIKIYYRVYNPGPGRYLGLGATIYPPGGGHYNDENDDTNKYFSGYSYTTRYRYFDIPSYASTGWYDLATGIHNVDGRYGAFDGMLDFERDNNAFEVEEDFDPPYIDDIGVVSGYSEVKAGDRVKVYVDIYNPSSVNLDTHIDYEVKSPSGKVYSDDDDTIIDKNGEETVYEYIDIPSNAETGWYKLKVEIEDDETLYSFSDSEGWDSNAFKVISSFSEPEITNYRLSKTKVKQGESFTIYYTINNPNQDDVPAWLGATFKDPFGRVVEDESHDKNVLLSPGSREYSRTFVMPSTATTGTYSIFLGVHGRNDYDFADYYGYFNYALTVEKSFSEPYISSWSISPTKRNPGKTFTIYYTIKNPNSYNVPVSLGATIYDPNNNHYDDTSNDVDSTTLSPGTNYKNRDFKVPSGASVGKYDIQAGIHKAVFNGLYDEYKWKYDELTVEKPFQDPYITSFSISPSKRNPGQEFTITYNINNPNSQNVDVSLGATIYDENNNNYDDGGNDIDRTTLSPGSNTKSRDFKVPSSASAGKYAVQIGIHKAVFNGLYDEYKWKRDVLTVEIPFTEPTLQSATISPTSLYYLDKFTITYNINNPNNYNVDVSLGATIYDPLSQDYSDSSNDVDRKTLGPGSNSVTRDFQIPFGVMQGKYDVQLGIHKAVFNGLYGNYLWKTDHITVSPLIPKIKDYTLSKTEISPGEEINIAYKIENKNKASIKVALGATFKDPDNNIVEDQANDVGSFTIGPDQTAWAYRKFKFPSDAAPGKYNMLLGIHKENFQGELDYLGYVNDALTVKRPFTEPFVESFDFSPKQAGPGEDITITYYITNPNTYAYDVSLGATIYDEDNAHYNDDAHDIDRTTLAAGNNQKTRYFTIPSEAAPGKYDIQVGIHKAVFNGELGEYKWKYDELTISGDDPELQDYGVAKSTITKGETINVWYKINNPKTSTVEVGLGATFRDENFDTYNDEANDISVELDPGVNTVSRQFYNSDMEPGTYDGAFAIHRVDSQGAFNGMVDSSDPFYAEDVITIEILPVCQENSDCDDDDDSTYDRCLSLLEGGAFCYNEPIDKECMEDDDCNGGSICSIAGRCAFKALPDSCDSNSDCGDYFNCVEQTCVPDLSFLTDEDLSIETWFGNLKLAAIPGGRLTAGLDTPMDFTISTPLADFVENFGRNLELEYIESEIIEGNIGENTYFIYGVVKVDSNGIENEIDDGLLITNGKTSVGRLVDGTISRRLEVKLSDSAMVQFTQNGEIVFNGNVYKRLASIDNAVKLKLAKSPKISQGILKYNPGSKQFEYANIELDFAMDSTKINQYKNSQPILSGMKDIAYNDEAITIGNTRYTKGQIKNEILNSLKTKDKTTIKNTFQRFDVRIKQGGSFISPADSFYDLIANTKAVELPVMGEIAYGVGSDIKGEPLSLGYGSLQRQLPGGGGLKIGERVTLNLFNKNEIASYPHPITDLDVAKLDSLITSPKAIDLVKMPAVGGGTIYAKPWYSAEPYLIPSNSFLGPNAGFSAKVVGIMALIEIATKVYAYKEAKESEELANQRIQTFCGQTHQQYVSRMRDYADSLYDEYKHCEQEWKQGQFEDECSDEFLGPRLEAFYKSYSESFCKGYRQDHWDTLHPELWKLYLEMPMNKLCVQRIPIDLFNGKTHMPGDMYNYLDPSSWTKTIYPDENCDNYQVVVPWNEIDYRRDSYYGNIYLGVHTKVNLYDANVIHVSPLLDEHKEQKFVTACHSEPYGLFSNQYDNKALHSFCMDDDVLNLGTYHTIILPKTEDAFNATFSATWFDEDIKTCFEDEEIPDECFITPGTKTLTKIEILGEEEEDDMVDVPEDEVEIINISLPKEGKVKMTKMNVAGVV